MKEMVKMTVVAFKKVVKALFAMLYASNSEAYWINKNLKNWMKNPIWKWYWTVTEKIAQHNMKMFARLST